jgi:hypothetical protein
MIGTTMPDHKFRIGQIVTLRAPVRFQDAPPGAYVIIARLPQSTDGQFNYRIKHPSELYERTAKENELSPSLSRSNYNTNSLSWCSPNFRREKAVSTLWS